MTGNLLAISILLFLVGLVLSHDKGAYEEQAALSTRNLTQVLEQNIEALISKTDVALQTIAHEISRQNSRGGLDAGALEELLATQQFLLPEIALLRITDGAGKIRYGARDLPIPRFDVSSRKFFIEAQQNPGAELIIEGPLQIRSTQRWGIFLARRLNRPDGNFMGVVYAAIEVEHFQRMFSSMDLGADSAVALRTADLRLVARHPAVPEGNATGTATAPAELKSALLANPIEGIYTARSSVDQTERTSGYSRVGNYPLYILVALATDNYLAPWRAEVGKVAALTALVILVLALSSWMAYRLWCRQWFAAEFLRESEERLRLMVENVRDYAVFMLDAEGRVATWNVGAQGLTGYPADDIIGRPFDILYLASDRAEEQPAEIRRQAEAEGSVSRDGWRPRKDGSQFLANTLVTAVRDGTGRLRGFTVILRDITELRRYQEHLEQLVEDRTAELKVSMAQFRILIEQAPTAMAMLDGELGYLAVSRRWIQKYGKNRGPLIGRNFYEVHPNTPERWQQIYRAALSGATLRKEEDLWIHPDGRKEWLRWSIHPWTNEAGNIGGIIISAEDITERKENRERLRESEARFRSAFEQAAVGLAYISLEGRWLRVNEKLCSIVGYDREELLSLDFRDISATADSDTPLDVAGQLLVRDKAIPSYVMERRYRRKDGALIWVNVTVSLVQTASGQADYFMAVVEDIQRRKEAELALAEERETRRQILEQQVAERTAELVSANRELQGFTYAASHDLKAPLGRINSFSSLLELNYRDRLEGDGVIFLDFIRRNAMRMSTLIEDLLAHAQIEQKILDLQPVDLQGAIQVALRDREGEIQQGGVQINLDLPEVTVRANPHCFAQVLRNLLENALKYSSQARPPVIEIGARMEAEHCLLWVRDNGIGFDMAYHDRIFEIFRRLHTYEEFPGSGIGLALVRKAMDRMGGRVWAESTPGRGATFFLELQA